MIERRSFFGVLAAAVASVFVKREPIECAAIQSAPSGPVTMEWTGTVGPIRITTHGDQRALYEEIQREMMKRRGNETA